MSDEDKESKTEPATEKKISDTIEKGNVPFSKEITNAASLLGMLFVGYAFVPGTMNNLRNTLSSVLANQHNWPLNTPEDAGNLMTLVGKSVGYAILPIIIPIMIFGLVSSFAQNKPSLLLNRISPKLSKISVAKGLKRLLGKHSVREFGKAMFKFGAAGIISAVLVYSQSDLVISHILVDTAKISTSIYYIFISVLITITFFMTFLAAADFVWVRRDWFDDIKMTVQEIKDERKQSEGDPIVKNKNRSIARDRSRRQMIKDVEKATFVVANPTHFAVALRYVPEVDKAPFVLAKGQDLIALKIREVAEQNNVPVTEDKLLARAMYKIAHVNQEVPPEFFIPLANIIKVLSDQKK